MDIKNLRKNIDRQIYEVEIASKFKTTNQNYLRALDIVRTKLQEAKMWAGKMLEAQGNAFPEELADHCEERKL